MSRIINKSTVIKNLSLQIIFRVAFVIFVYMTMEDHVIPEDIERKLETIVKGEVGQV